MSMLNNSTTVYNGTATITMRLEPVPDVPISIKTMYNNTLTIWNQDQIITLAIRRYLVR
jgi:hypothetical protein